MIKKIMIGGFWALVLLPNLLFPLVKGSGDSGSAENRTLAEFPVFQAKDFEAYPSEVDSYINDHAAFRNRFLSINSVLNLKLFGYAFTGNICRTVMSGYGMGTALPSWRNISGNIPVSRCWTPGSILIPTGIIHGTIRQIPTGTLQGDMWVPR